MHVRMHLMLMRLNKKQQKLLNVSLRRLRSYSRTSAMSRLVCGVQERRMSGRKHASKSARRSMHARQKERVLRSRKTAKKHHALLKKVRGSSRSNKELRRSKIVVMQLLEVVWLLISRPQHLHQHTTAAAVKYFNHVDIGSKLCRIGL